MKDKIRIGSLVYIKSSTDNKPLRDLGVGIVIDFKKSDSPDYYKIAKDNIYTILWNGSIEKHVREEWIVEIEK